MAINLFVPSFRIDEILKEIRICLEKGWTGLGFKTVEFENKWKEYTGLQHAHFLSSNTVGLHLALHILKKKFGWSDGDEIITTPITFVSTNHAILYERLKPVFADVDDMLCMSPESVEARITSKTRAVMFVGIGGNTGQYEKIISLCKKKNLKLILDAAHMSGTRFNGKHVGSECDVSIFSYQAVKNLPTSDSGMICFADPALDHLARQLSWLGINKDTYQRFQGIEGGYRWKYDVENVGFKYHGNSIQAAMALVQLKYLDEDNKYRNHLASIYDELLKDMPDVERVRMSKDCQSSRHLYQIFVDNRDQLIQHFYANNIFPGVHYIDNTEFSMYSYAKGTCPNAARRSNQIISLPLHLQLKKEDCVQVIDVLKAGILKFGK
ncbi:MAG TPA: DegT/DnrJ/EryC1/StrS family aminotransferase [Bacteroidia bacterium]